MTGVLTDIPNQLGSALDITAENAGLLLSCCILVSIGLVLAMAGKKVNILTTAIPMIATMGFLVAIAWLPYWILFVIALLIAGIVGMKFREVVQ